MYIFHYDNFTDKLGNKTNLHDLKSSKDRFFVKSARLIVLSFRFPHFPRALFQCVYERVGIIVPAENE